MSSQRPFLETGLVLLMWALLLAPFVFGRFTVPAALSYTDFRKALRENRVAEVSVSPTVIRGRMKAEPGTGASAEPAARGASFETVRIEDPDLMRELLRRGVSVTGETESGFWKNALSWLFPLVLLLLLVPLLRGGAAGARGGLMSVGRVKAKVYVQKDVGVTFADVAGVDEAKEELSEVIEFLRTPEKFRRLGGHIPKGILLVGPPGTGKTLLAKAVAGEAGVPFFSISGSEFVELFVGVGASRVRDLFDQARAKAPCIVFIDELDALGKARGFGPMAHEEREQTLNQLLVEMDGFDPRAGVILMAATNRPEILDPALLRAGRFDRHVLVDRPDKAGRLAILEVHARGVKLDAGADLQVIAGMTAGFVGADLANVVNEAALLAARRGGEAVTLDDLQEAVERIVGGLEKKNRVLNTAERERVAHHEVGHALVALSIPGSDAVQKISIIPRGIAALGYTIQLPTEDRFLMTCAELENKIATLLGGRVAEEMIYGDTSTGAQDDLLKATDVAKSMVKTYGMSRELGAVSFERERPPFLFPAGQPAPRGDYSEATAREIDCEVRRIIDEQYARVRTILQSRRQVLQEAARVLLDRETMSGEELNVLVARRPRDLAPEIAAATSAARFANGTSVRWGREEG
jgi:cell division protease FtsH